MERPFCPLCKTNHFAREDHDFGKDTSAERGEAPRGGERRPGRSGDCSSSRLTAQAGGTPVKDTSREGHRVLNAEGVSSDATRTAATAKARPATANLGKTAGEKGNAEKPAAGNRKTAPKFDRTAYQREYMRGWRKRKAGVS